MATRQPSSKLKSLAKLTETQYLYNWYDQASSLNQAWDRLQMEMNCCGLTSHSDWSLFRPSDIKSYYYPSSCCPKSLCSEPRFGYKPFCLCDSRTIMVNKIGCKKLLENLDSVLNLILKCVALIGFAMLFLCYMIRQHCVSSSELESQSEYPVDATQLHVDLEKAVEFDNNNKPDTPDRGTGGANNVNN